VTIFGQIDTLTAALHAKKMSDELPLNTLNLRGICFFLILDKEKNSFLHVQIDDLQQL